MVSLCMKRDGRTLDHQTLETIRLMAIERVREGERPSEVIEDLRVQSDDDLQVDQDGVSFGRGTQGLALDQSDGASS